MHCTVKMTEDLYWVGASDRRLALFESVYPIPRGVSYNAYVLLDEKTVLLDTVDQSVAGQFFENLAHVLGGRPLDYIVVHHMEPDHAKTLEETVRRYPDAKIICNAKIRDMIRNYFTFDIDSRAILMTEGGTYCFGKHTFAYVMAPMVHWPEVMVSYESSEKVLFSADGFGRFGAVAKFDEKADWASEARRYYLNIVGKFGANVQSVLKKAAGLDIAMICPLHGPVLTETIPQVLAVYDLWSRYMPETDGVLVAYASLHGNTAQAANALADRLEAAGMEVQRMDLARCDASLALAEAFRYSKVVLAASSYNGGVVPCMEDFLRHLLIKNYQKRTFALMENGSWGPCAVRTMKGLLEQMKDITVIEPIITLRGTLKERDLPQLDALAKALVD